MHFVDICFKTNPRVIKINNELLCLDYYAHFFGTKIRKYVNCQNVTDRCKCQQNVKWVGQVQLVDAFSWNNYCFKNHHWFIKTLKYPDWALFLLYI